MNASAIFNAVLGVIRSIPAGLTGAIIQAIPEAVEKGIYAGWLKFKLYFELLLWAATNGNAQALASVVAIGKQFVSEVETVMSGVSGSSILKALMQSSTLFATSRGMLNASIAEFEAAGFSPDSPITKAALASLKSDAIIAQYAPPAETADPNAAPSDAPANPLIVQ